MLAKTQMAFLKNYYNFDADADAKISNGCLLSSQVFLKKNKPYTLIDIPLYEKNENKFFQFSNKNLHFTNGPDFH